MDMMHNGESTHEPAATQDANSVYSTLRCRQDFLCSLWETVPSRRCAIYSAGPSIVRLKESGAFTNHEKRYGLRICINAAINHIPDRFAHWYAAGDAVAYRDTYTTRRPSIGWCCLCDDYRAQILAAGGWDGFKSLMWPDLPALSRVDRPSYSITAAIALADKLGAHVIDIYGHDAAVGKDNAHGSGADIYTDERMRKERQELADITRAISAHINIIQEY
jgi:hypothetical protein